MAKEKETESSPKASGFVAQRITFPAYGVAFTSTEQDPFCNKQLEQYIKEKANG